MGCSWSQDPVRGPQRLAEHRYDAEILRVAKAAGFGILENLVVERYPFDDIAEYIREKRVDFGAIVVGTGGGSAKRVDRRVLIYG